MNKLDNIVFRGWNTHKKIQFHANKLGLVFGLFPLIIYFFIYLAFLARCSNLSSVYPAVCRQRWEWSAITINLHSFSVISSATPHSDKRVLITLHWLISWPQTNWLQSRPKTAEARDRSQEAWEENDDRWWSINFFSFMLTSKNYYN